MTRVSDASADAKVSRLFRSKRMLGIASVLAIAALSSAVALGVVFGNNDSSSPSPPSATILHQVVGAFVAAGTVESFTAARKASIAAVIASTVDVDAQVQVDVTPASCLISYAIAVGSASAAAAAAGTLTLGIFSSVSALQAAFDAAGLTDVVVEGIHTLPTVLAEVISAPASPPVSYASHSLPASRAGVLHTLAYVTAAGLRTPVARSYDGHQWEALGAGFTRGVASELQAHCGGGLEAGAHSTACMVELAASAGDSYLLEEHLYTPPGSERPSWELQASRFLHQATFVRSHPHPHPSRNLDLTSTPRHSPVTTHSHPSASLTPHCIIPHPSPIGPDSLGDSVICKRDDARRFSLVGGLADGTPSDAPPCALPSAVEPEADEQCPCDEPSPARVPARLAMAVVYAEQAR